MSHRTLFRVDAELFEQFPDYVVGCVAAVGIEPDAGADRVAELLSTAQLRAKATYEDIDLKDREPFSAWREAFSTAGWSASRFPASVEALHRRIQRGGDLPQINVPVDLANSAVLYYSVPVGTHDLSSFDGRPLEVRRASHGDTFVSMSGEPEPPDDGEIVYAVGSDVRTRRWVWRQGRNGLVPETASDIFFPIDGFTDRTYDAVVAAMNYLSEICGSNLKAQVHIGLVSRETPAFDIQS